VKHALDAVGFIVPRSRGRPILATTWVASKWVSRAPEGHVLIRSFFGGAWGEEILAKDDEGLVALARSELRDLMGLDAEPMFAKVFRFVRSNPQPVVGHVARLGRIRAALERRPGLYVAGGAYDGIGLPDCVRQGEAVAAKIIATL
jgi:oxygen-dependent protoporphyrinogen oxidase